jgi:hypothetical protein
MAVNLGGFFVTLGLKSSADSFGRALKDLKDLGDESKRSGEKFQSFVTNSIKGLEKLGAAAMGSAYAVSNIQAKMELTATKAGMGYTEFNKFSSALKLVGVDSANVASKMANVNSALNDFKVGKNSDALAGLAKNLALLGIDLKTFESLTPTQRVSLVAQKAEAARGTEKEVGARNIADEIFGIGEAIIATQQKGSAYPNFAALLAAGSGATWDSNQEDVTKNSQAFNSLTLQMEQMWKTFGEKMGNTFRPMINNIADFIEKHKAEITGFFTDVSELLLNLAKVLGPVMKSIGSVVADLVSEVSANVLVSEFEKTNPEAYKKIKEGSKKAGFKEYSFAENLLDVTNKKANETQAAIEFQAMAIRLSGQAYTEAPTTAERAALGNPNATSIVFNGVTISGQDFNKVANYMSEHPGVDVKEVVKAVMVMAGTK